MAKDNELIITAGLDVNTTVSNVENELKNQVNPILNKDRALKIVCNIDTEKSINSIQSQLDAISKKLSIKVPEINFEATQEKSNKSTTPNKVKPEYKPNKRQTTNLSEIKRQYQEIYDVLDKDISASWVKNAGGELSGFSVTVKQAGGIVETFKHTLDELGDAKLTSITGSDKGIAAIDKAVSKAYKDIASFKQSHTSILSGLSTPLQEVENAIDGLKNGTVSIETFEKVFNSLKTEAAAIGSSLKSTGSSFNVFDNAVNKAQNFDNTIKSLTTDINNLTTASTKTKLTADIESASAMLNKMQTLELANGRDQAWADAYGELSTLIQDVTNNLKAARKEEEAFSQDQTLKNKIAKTSATLDVYASSNKKAVTSTKLMSDGVTTFAQKWSELTAKIKSGDLSADEFKHLNEEIAVFKKEADAAGLSTSAFFKNMGSQIRSVITQWVSLTAVISKIHSAIGELKEIDSVLTEISKTSDRTEQSLRNLGDTSFDSASKYGRVASDYLLGVQEMSRAGYGDKQSEELAEVSILAQAAGDMTAEMSNEYLVATDAAYDLKGNVEELNKVLDGQNYITNRNALNMENLAQATKVSASQAAVSGVAIDELTAAVGTMVATTQQGGDVAGRAFKGILMNLQQVKADADEIGDGGEAITTESLSKYEEAAKALGVSLKEVKNGVWELRDPMQILKELSEAVSKESEGSIKVANLINAVGGKFRGNQLIALLDNWDTYEKMLSEFNSNEAVGSAMEEAEKSANNWAGSLNQLSNSWNELVNQFVKSNNMIEVIQSVDKVIQSASDSSATGALKTVADILTGIIKLAGDVSDTVGTIPTLLTTLAGISAFKGVGEPKTNTPIYAPLQ